LENKSRKSIATTSSYFGSKKTSSKKNDYVSMLQVYFLLVCFAFLMVSRFVVHPSFSRVWRLIERLLLSGGANVKVE